MKKSIIFFILFLCTQSFLLPNPIDNTPFTRFSELVFDDNNKWTLELFFQFGYWTSETDSIILSVANARVKLNSTFAEGTNIGIITADSLSIPFAINRNGDSLAIFTYSTLYSPNVVKEDVLIFGDYPDATVGAPDSGYSILRYYTKLASNNYFTIDCLTNKPSLGVVNDTVGLAGTLKGHIYDKNNRLIKNYYTPVGGNGLIFLEAFLNISSDGSFTTSIFNTIFKQNFLVAEMVDWGGFYNYLNIEPFELNNIHPDTVVFHDIHLTDTCLYCTLVDAVKKDEPPPNDELTLINYPNPFNLSTNFYVKIPDRIKNKTGIISIYNINGKLIRVIPFKNGSTAYWDARDMKGNIAASGIYYYRLIINKQILKNGSMILLK